jgi:galactose mutarotase-like enzyme
MAFTIGDHVGPGGLRTYVLAGGDTVAEIIPERGALVTRLRIREDELLFLDESTLVDRARSVRGGIPVLFPIAGRLADDRWEHEGRTYSMNQHGFARNRAWEVVARETTATSARLTCRLADDGPSRAQYPWAFELELSFVLREHRLHLEAALTNRDTRPMPHALGYHPYFQVPLERKSEAVVESDATEAWDNARREFVRYQPPDLSAGEVDLNLRDHALPGTVLGRPPLRPARLDWDPAFDQLVVWTLPGRPFVCVEPWVASPGALVTGEGLRWVEPGEVDRLAVVISS